MYRRDEKSGCIVGNVRWIHWIFPAFPTPSLGNPPNMQIRAAIMENPSFVNISVTMDDIKIILVSMISKFWWFHLYFLLNTQIETANAKKSRFRPYLSTVFIRLLAALDDKPHKTVLKINVSRTWR